MLYIDLQNLVEGFFAYDSGAVDSGIRDEARKAEVKALLLGLNDQEQRKTLARLVRDGFVCEAAVAQGYGIEDVYQFLKWLDDWLWDGGGL